jgi:hypothetical protein
MKVEMTCLAGERCLMKRGSLLTEKLWRHLPGALAPTPLNTPVRTTVSASLPQISIHDPIFNSSEDFPKTHVLADLSHFISFQILDAVTIHDSFFRKDETHEAQSTPA